jgi:hypothetical protein
LAPPPGSEELSDAPAGGLENSPDGCGRVVDDFDNDGAYAEGGLNLGGLACLCSTVIVIRRQIYEFSVDTSLPSFA